MGGRWKTKSGKVAGLGLYHHYKTGISLLWPEIQWHRWNELLLKEWLEHRCIGIMGPTNSGKTNSFAVFHLFDYYCFPQCTTTLVCSTTQERLEDRIWGEIKKFHKLAKARFAWIPGNLIESRWRLVTDNKSQAADGRDFRNGLIGVPCFLSGTFVDTPRGKVPIEEVRTGDKVFNAVGIGTVTETHCRRAIHAVRVSLSDGRTIDCTPEHPFFTRRGWVKAIDLTTFDTVLSAYETMCLVRRRFRPGIPQPEVLLKPLRGETSPESVRSLRSNLLSNPAQRNGKSEGEILQSELCWEMGRETQRVLTGQHSTLQTLREADADSSYQPGLLFRAMQKPSRGFTLPSVREGVHVDSRIPCEGTDSFLRLVLQEESDWSEEFEKECFAHFRRVGCLETIPELNSSLSYSNRIKAKRRQRTLVSDRYCVSGTETCGGDRWWSASDSGQESKGHQEDGYFEPSWVDSVEILEPSSDPRFEKSYGGYSVYNLEVSGHPSYSVNGVIVHNCKKGGQYVGLGDFIGIKNKRVRLCGDELQLLPRSFIDCIPNLIKNADCKITGMGNPKETLDALGGLCEPAASVGGWDGGIDQSPKTKTWETKWPNGVCIQLCGSDSPNLDVPKDAPIPFPFLIKRKDMEDDATLWGKDDWHYTMFNEGRMPRGQGSRRVLTVQLCKKMGALNDPMWANTHQVEVAFLDAAYRAVGGDRCVFGRLKYGQEASVDAGSTLVSGLISQDENRSNFRNILALLELTTIPITSSVAGVVSPVDEPEEQIVSYVQRECTQHGIKPNHFFFDSGMRTSLVSAFARIWSPDVVPIDCGGTPSERKVSQNIDVKCSDYYSKYITELWYSVRLIIEAGQFRGLTQDAMQEGCAREWKLVGKNKIEVETKAEMKTKTGRSPDLFDALAIGCEGARRCGFIIAKLGNLEYEEKDHNWKRDLQEKARKVATAGALTYST